LTSSNVIGLYDGSAQAYYEVIDVENARVIYDEVRSSSFGRGEEPRVSFTASFEQVDRLVENELLTRLGEQIAKDLYGYTGD
jgi:hypothetical protein